MVTISQNAMVFQFLLDLPKNLSLKIFALVGSGWEIRNISALMI